MNRPRGVGFFFLRKGTLLLAIKVLLTLFALVYAASMVTTTTTYQASMGAALSVTNNLKAMDKGFAKSSSTVSAAGATCGGNVTFAGSPGVANTDLTAGDIVYVVQVNTTTSAQTNHCFTVELVITPSGGSQQTYTLYLATGSSVSADQTIDCKFDIGASLPSSPYSFKVTVQ